MRIADSRLSEWAWLWGDGARSVFEDEDDDEDEDEDEDDFEGEVHPWLLARRGGEGDAAAG